MIDIPKYEVGSNIIIQKTVGKDDTGLNFGSGKLNTLFATPSLVALMIEAAVDLVDGKLPDGLVSICLNAEVTHEDTTILGETVSIKVEVEHVNGNHIFLRMIAYDEVGIIGQGSIERIIVSEKSLLDKAYKRAENLQSLNF